MDKIYDLIEKIEEGINNLEQRTNFPSLLKKNLLPGLKSSLANYKKSKNKNFLKGMIDEFHSTATASTEGSDTYNTDIWDANIDVSGKQTTLEDLFSELEDLYSSL